MILKSIRTFRKSFVNAMMWDLVSWISLFIIAYLNLIIYNYIVEFLPYENSQGLFILSILLLTCLTYMLMIYVMAYFKRKVYIIVKGKEVDINVWYRYHLLLALPFVLSWFISLVSYTEDIQAYLFTGIFSLYCFFGLYSNLYMKENVRATFRKVYTKGIPFLFTNILGSLPFIFAMAVVLLIDGIMSSLAGFVVKIIVWIGLFYFFRNYISWYNKNAGVVFIVIGYLLALIFSTFFIPVDMMLGMNYVFKIILVLSVLLVTQWGRYYLYLTK